MLTLKSERVIFVDCDDTLVMHGESGATDSQVTVQDHISDDLINVTVNAPMVRLVREESHRGSTIIVWSRGGWEWARNVVLALGLQNDVAQVMTKPYAYFDDKDVSEWLKDRVYISPETTYKQLNKGVKSGL